MAAWLAGAPPARAAGPTACDHLRELVPAEGGAVFLASYPTAGAGPLGRVAFLYDNAAAVVALVGCGERARGARIGDAILAALARDRAWHDGRLRNAYAAGPVGDGPVKLGGWWDPAANRWSEDAYQVGSDAGNAAWAILALMALDRGAENRRFRDGAVSIGSWVAALSDSRGAGGFTGGYIGWEPSPRAAGWKSTEHNTDLAAAFSLLFAATGDPAWKARAAHAAEFVAAMWDRSGGYFDEGTLEDGITRNPAIALDAQLWPQMAIPGLAAAHGAAVATLIDRRLRADGGYSYSTAELGLWTEGTAQAALLARLRGRGAEAGTLLSLVRAQTAPGGGLFAIQGETLATGLADPTNPNLPRLYLHLIHLAPAAWAALAEQGFNPFTGTGTLP